DMPRNYCSSAACHRNCDRNCAYCLSQPLIVTNVCACLVQCAFSAQLHDWFLLYSL
ncbi:hypothetical protein J6590_100142, partial [Homalodisca vitripennis]